MALSETLLQILVCPKCHEGLDYRPQAQRLVCQACGLAFRIEDDIPVLLLDQAETIEK